MKFYFRLTVIIIVVVPAILLADYSYFKHLPSHVKSYQPISVHSTQDIYQFVPKKTRNKILISKSSQQKYVHEFMSHYFSPWREHIGYITLDFLRRYIVRETDFYQHHLGLGENFHQHTQAWFKQIQDNMDMKKYPNNIQEAITVDNAYIRLFPTISPHFGDQHEAGNGYPFDDFQLSVAWAGTPVHILQMSADGAWAFVMTPSVSGWVEAKTLATVDRKFMARWRKEKYIAMITRKYPIKDVKGHYRFDAYLGSVLPLDHSTKEAYSVLAPVKDINNKAQLVLASIPKVAARSMPWLPTPEHFAMLIHQLLGVPYGWGGIYYYGDCSSSLKSLFAPFGIWLPRNSAAQARAARNMSLENLLPKARRAAILKYGKPFTTLISVTGHVMLYIGKYKGDVMTFQNVWAFATMSRNRKMGRDIIGRAVLMPLKLSYGRSGIFPQIDAAGLRITFFGDR